MPVQQDPQGDATAAWPRASLALATGAGRSLLPARPRPGHRGGAGPLPADDGDRASSGYGRTRARQLGNRRAQLAKIAAALPATPRSCVTALGRAAKPPHCNSHWAAGKGLLRRLTSTRPPTRQPGLVVLTEPTPNVIGGWGQTVPPQKVG